MYDNELNESDFEIDLFQFIEIFSNFYFLNIK